jgi:very-short-patch-repair endonuclease/predicted RNA-binding Zn-ribbon protein involved in translation (DUF1610 family)
MKMTIERIQSLIDTRLLSTIYVNGSTPLKWRCGCGEQFDRSWNRMREAKHKTCTACAKRLAGQSKAYTHTQVFNYIQSKESLLLSKYSGIYTDPLDIQCKCGSVFQRSFQTFKASAAHRCEDCVGKTKWTTPKAAKLIEQLGGTLIGNYGKTVKFKCSNCSTATSRLFSDIKQSNHSLCSKCSHNNAIRHNSLQHQDVKEYVNQQGCALLSEYETITKPLSIACSCGKHYQQQFSVFRTRPFNGCAECTMLHNNPNYTSQTLNVLQSPEALNYLHHSQRMSLTQIATYLAVSKQTLSNAMKAAELPVQIFHAPSSGEAELAERLSEHVGVLTSNRTLIPPQELDIIIPEHKIAVEFNGLYWHSERQQADNHYHYKKYKACKSAGYQLISIFEDEWNNKPEVVLDLILSKCGTTSATKYFARNTKIVTLDSTPYSNFVIDNHLQGKGRASIRYGLQATDGRLVAVMGFTQNSHNNYTLERFCSSGVVVGGFSKLLKAFVRQHQPSQILSFVDHRVSDGQVYTKSGFVIDKELPPDYGYVKHSERLHKSNFRRKQLQRKFINFDETLSEWENCNNNGYYRIWDCGKSRVVFDATSVA